VRHYKCGLAATAAAALVEGEDTGHAMEVSANLFVAGAVFGLLSSLAYAYGLAAYAVTAQVSDYPTNVRCVQCVPF
jgi:hypothetical protein